MTSQATRSHLEEIIAGLSEGVLLIETDGRITYANPAALRMHGAADLAGLGATVDGYRRNYVPDPYHADEGAHPVHPVERVMNGEAVADEVARVVRREDHALDWAHRFRSLVMRDEAGRPDYVVLIISDVSDQLEAEERFERAFNANPAPAAICRLADLRFARVNQGFLDLTGFRTGDVVGRTVYEVDVLRNAERRDIAVERLRAGRTIPQMEACLLTPDDEDKLVVVAGQPIEMGDERCMLFTFADLEPRRRAEAALRHSEERFNKCFRLAPIPFSVAAARGHRMVDVNEAFCALTGWGAAEVAGRGAAELGLWAEAEALRRFERALGEAGQVRGLEARLRAKDGTEFDALVAAETVTLNGEPSLLCAFQDISERRRSEAELVAAIEAVMADASWFSQAVVEKLAALRQPRRAGRNEPPTGLGELTGREREVLGLICRGLGNDEMAGRLGVSAHTVRNHVAALYRKLGVNRRSALVVWARERGFGDDAPRPARQAEERLKKTRPPR